MIGGAETASVSTRRTTPVGRAGAAIDTRSNSIGTTLGRGSKSSSDVVNKKPSDEVAAGEN